MVQTGTARPIIGLPLHLSQIVQNLLLNALKYSDAPVELKLQWEAEQCQLIISDKGIGIPKAEQTYVFNSFFRSKNVGMIPGTGLGLYIVKRAIELHDGQIYFDSQVDQGSTFYVLLPYRPKTLNP